MKINHAILHILDFDSAVNVMSQRELDIESRTVRNFVTTHLRRARTSADNKRATFAESSAFGGELKGYFFGEREFVDLSQQIAEFISSELTKAEKAESTDVLVADFDDDEDARWFAVMLLGSKQAFMHEVGREEGEVRNDIARHYAILPNPSQKVPSYAIVRASTTVSYTHLDVYKRQTYNGDHMSMYAVNASVPKTLVRHLVRYAADVFGGRIAEVLLDILDTPVSPELLPPTGDGEIAQKTEDLVGPYELHDYFLYYLLRFGFEPGKIYRMALKSFEGVYDVKTVHTWLRTFYRRFFAQQFKRSCLPDGPKVGSVTLSPRGDWRMPSDASSRLWLAQIDALDPID